VYDFVHKCVCSIFTCMTVCTTLCGICDVQHIHVYDFVPYSDVCGCNSFISLRSWHTHMDSFVTHSCVGARDTFMYVSSWHMHVCEFVTQPYVCIFVTFTCMHSWHFHIWEFVTLSYVWVRAKFTCMSSWFKIVADLLHVMRNALMRWLRLVGSLKS